MNKATGWKCKLHKLTRNQCTRCYAKKSSSSTPETNWCDTSYIPIAGFSDSLGLCYVEGVLLLFLPTNSKIVDTTKHQFQHFLVVSRASGWTTGQFAKHQTTATLLSILFESTLQNYSMWIYNKNLMGWILSFITTQNSPHIHRN